MAQIQSQFYPLHVRDMMEAVGWLSQKSYLVSHADLKSEVGFVTYTAGMSRLSIVFKIFSWFFERATRRANLNPFLLSRI